MQGKAVWTRMGPNRTIGEQPHHQLCMVAVELRRRLKGQLSLNARKTKGVALTAPPLQEGLLKPCLLSYAPEFPSHFSSLLPSHLVPLFHSSLSRCHHFLPYWDERIHQKGRPSSSCLLSSSSASATGTWSQHLPSWSIREGGLPLTRGPTLQHVLWPTCYHLQGVPLALPSPSVFSFCWAFHHSSKQTLVSHPKQASKGIPWAAHLEIICYRFSFVVMLSHLPLSPRLLLTGFSLQACRGHQWLFYH